MRWIGHKAWLSLQASVSHRLTRQPRSRQGSLCGDNCTYTSFMLQRWPQAPCQTHLSSVQFCCPHPPLALWREVSLECRGWARRGCWGVTGLSLRSHLHPFSRQTPLLCPVQGLFPRPQEGGPSRISPVRVGGSWDCVFRIPACRPFPNSQIRKGPGTSGPTCPLLLLKPRKPPILPLTRR